jgi:hypothetical protein
MKKYHLTVLTGAGTLTVTVEAKSFSTTTNNSTSSGFYSFFGASGLVACYPIERTIISKIENI